MKPPSPEATKTPALEDLSTAELVDMLGPLDEELDRVAARITPTKKKAEAIEKILRKRVPEAEAKNLDGKEFFAALGQKNLATRWKIESLFKRLKRDLFLGIAKVDAEAVKALLKDNDEWEKYCTQDHTGPRTIVTRRYPTTEVKAA